MEKHNLKENLKVFGIQVKSFPNGIGNAFDELIKKTGNHVGERNYYGISTMKNGTIFYVATAEEKHEGEAAKYNCEEYTIEKGEYLTVTVAGWQQKTDTIKDAFSEMMQDARVDKAKPAVEWYKDEHEMLCMLSIIINM